MPCQRNSPICTVTTDKPRKENKKCKTTNGSIGSTGTTAQFKMNLSNKQRL
jgi:hypothetical protein